MIAAFIRAISEIRGSTPLPSERPSSFAGPSSFAEPTEDKSAAGLTLESEANSLGYIGTSPSMFIRVHP